MLAEPSSDAAGAQASQIARTRAGMVIGRL